MAVKTFNTRVKLKYDSNANWKPASGDGLVLLAGEFAFDNTKKNFFIGDGITGTKNLKYIIGEAIMADYTALGSDETPVAITSSMTLNKALANLQGQINSVVSGGVTDVQIGGTSIVTNNVANIVTDGTYSSTLNKVATERTVKDAIEALDDTAINISSLSANYDSTGHSRFIFSGIGQEDGHLVADNVNVNTVDVDGEYRQSANTQQGTTRNWIATEDTVRNAVAALDGNITGTPGLGKTLTAFSQTDGVITASFDNISITASQISDLSTNIVTSVKGDGTYLEPSTASTGAVTISHKTRTIVASSATANMIPGGTFTNKVLSYDGAGHINDEDITTYTLPTVNVANASATGYFADAKETKDYVDSAINKALDSEVTFMGVTSTLPSTPTNGDLWKVGGAITIPATSSATSNIEKAVIGDAIIYKYDESQGATGNGWYVIPSGDESFADTWRPIFVNGTSFIGNGINTGDLNIKGGSSTRVTVSTDSDRSVHNTVIIEHGFVTTPTSGVDTAKSQGDSVTVMTGISGDSYGHVTGYTTNTFTVPVVNTHTLAIGANNVYNTYNPSVQGSTDQIVTISGSGPISTVSTEGSATTITISHDGPGANGADITAVTTPSALKVAYDAKGHITRSEALTATDITCTEAVYGTGSSTTNTQVALTNLASAVGSISIGTLNTTNTTAQTTSSNESFSGTINLHKISKTASTDDLIQGMTIVLDCGNASTTIDS